ncbi:hypothetical protein [Microbacterium sp. NIBRBAC000506063]|uniref:hypothetical protein n=1 Tax=Microbacterium sp. NIBRBAC000506063 TaxID=2734618 RepID=UPI001CB72C1C|nr:hypothetical protein [Microbacterium sp. NIBRBAC000506063]
MRQKERSSLVLHTSAHVDEFPRQALPEREQWPDLEFTLPALPHPPQLNAAAALIDDSSARFGPDRPCLLTPTASA